MYPDYEAIRSKISDEDFIREVNNLMVNKTDASTTIIQRDNDYMQMTADYMAELLMDDSNSTYKMYEQLVSEYLHNDEGYRNGLDAACMILTGYSLRSISEEILSKIEEKDMDEDKEIGE